MIPTGLLQKDIEDVTSRSISTLNNLSCKVILHTTELDYEVDPNHLVFVDCQRDYVGQLGERYFIKFMMSMGDFIYDIYPHRNNMEVTLEFNVIDGEGKDIKIQEKYKCVLSNVHNGLDVPGMMAIPKDILNQSEIHPIDIECVSRVLEVLNYLPANCNIADATIEDAIYYSIHQAIDKNKPMIDGEQVNMVFDVEEPHNKLKYTKISTMNAGMENLTLLSFPTFLQQEYGVYNGGISTFVQKVRIKEQEFKDVISIYPTYDYSVYNDSKTKKKLCFYVPMTGGSDLSEGTFFQDGNVLKAIATTDSFTTDKGEDEIRKSGTEVIFTHPKSLINQSATKSDGEKDLQYDKDKIANITTINKTTDGTRNVKYLGVTGNAYVARSEIMISSAIGFELTWNNGAWYEIIPGMPICILRETRQEGIITYYGKVVGLYMSYNRIKKTSVVKIKAIAKREIKEGEE